MNDWIDLFACLFHVLSGVFSIEFFRLLFIFLINQITKRTNERREKMCDNHHHLIPISKNATRKKKQALYSLITRAFLPDFNTNGFPES